VTGDDLPGGFEDELPPPVPPEARPPGWTGRLRGHGIDLTPLRISRDFRRLFAGQAISELGTQISFVAVQYHVYRLTGSTAMVGLMALVEAVPLVVLPMVGGALAGPVLAGVLIASVGVEWAYVLDAVTYLAVVVALVGMAPSPPTAERLAVGLSAIRGGFRLLRSNQILQGAFLIDLNAMIFGIPVALYPAFVLDVLDLSPAVLGFLYAAEALGSLLVALLSGRAKHVRRQGLITLVMCACWGAGVIGFGLSGTLWVALLCILLASAADMVSGLYRDAIVKTVTPDELRGRLEGIGLAVWGTGPSLGNAEAGFVAALTSVRTSIVSGGIACIVAAGVLALLLPRYRRYDAKEAEAA
jgi:hypothetical protein